MRKILKDENVPIAYFSDVRDEIFIRLELEYDRDSIISNAPNFLITGQWRRNVIFPATRMSLINQRIRGDRIVQSDDLTVENMIFNEEGFQHETKFNEGGKRWGVFYKTILYDLKGSTRGLPLTDLFAKKVLSGDFHIQKETRIY